MRWFKHLSDMLDDVFVSQLVDEFGASGYGIWCGILETYAKYANENCGDFVQIPWRSLVDRLRTSVAKLQRVLNVCETNQKLIQRHNPRCLEISIPKMLDLRDEWTHRKKKDSGVTREKLPNKNKEEQKKEIKKTEKNPSVSPLAGETQKRAARLSENWEPKQELVDWALGKHPTVDYQYQTELFRNHYLGNGKPMLDWNRTWQNWIARSKTFDRSATTVNPRHIVPAEQRQGGVLEL